MAKGTLGILGCPEPDETGTLRLAKVEEKDGSVSLSCGHHTFVRCFVKDGKSIVQVIDASAGVRFEGDIQCLCWAR